MRRSPSRYAGDYASPAFHLHGVCQTVLDMMSRMRRRLFSTETAWRGRAGRRFGSSLLHGHSLDVSTLTRDDLIVSRDVARSILFAQRFRKLRSLPHVDRRRIFTTHFIEAQVTESFRPRPIPWSADDHAYSTPMQIRVNGSALCGSK